MDGRIVAAASRINETLANVDLLAALRKLGSDPGADPEGFYMRICGLFMAHCVREGIDIPGMMDVLAEMVSPPVAPRPRRAPCTGCGGSGYRHGMAKPIGNAEMAESLICFHCRGAGGFALSDNPCGACGATGEVGGIPCMFCGGTRYQIVR
jgi:hypothetical protein